MHLGTIALRPALQTLAAAPTMMLADNANEALASSDLMLPMITLAKSAADKQLEEIFTSFPIYFTGFAVFAVFLQLVFGILFFDRRGD